MNDYLKELRHRIGHMKVVIPGVRGLILNERGELLLLKRGDVHQWSLPAGVVDVGESALAALCREVKEECGLDVVRAEPFGLYSDPKYSVVYPNGDEVQTFTVAFRVTEWAGQVDVDGEECIESGFFPVHDLPAPMYPIHIETIADFRQSDGRFVIK